MKAPYDNSFGTWKVTTEGDVEGRTTTNLGIYEGHIDEIALHLADKCSYALSFELVEPMKAFTPTKSYVDIALPPDSETWDLGMLDRVSWFNNFLKNRPVEVAPSNSHASVRIVAENPQEIEIQAALSKLTEREKELLNLKG